VIFENIEGLMGRPMPLDLPSLWKKLVEDRLAARAIMVTGVTT